MVARWSLRILASVFLATTLAACGFHLRGASPVVFDTLYVEGVQQGPTWQSLKQRLVSQGVRVVDASAIENLPEGATLIRVLVDQHERAVTATTVGAQVRELTLKVRFDWQRYDDKRRMVGLPSLMVVDQAMSYSEAQDLAKQSEEMRVFRDLQSQLVSRVLRQLSSKAP